MFKALNKDLEVIIERDPAARTKYEVLLTYPGLHALWCHKVNHWLWNKNWKTFSRWLSTVCRFFTGIEIHPAAKIGTGVFIDHGLGVVIGETAEIGNNVTLYHGVTLGGVSLQKGKRHPTIEDDVVIGAGAKVLGAITIGKKSRVGANSVVVKSVPPDSVVVGIPGQIITRSKTKSLLQKDFQHDQIPDTFGISMASVLLRLQRIEESLEGQLKGESVQEMHPPTQGIWQGEDFMI